MTIAGPSPGLQPGEYEEIEAAVLETARGRSFLMEYARRIRARETARMLDAIERLEARLEAQQALAPAEAFTLADRLTELSWTLRERGVEDFVCNKIDALAREFRGVGGAAQAALGGLAPEPALVAESTAPNPQAEHEAAATEPAPEASVSVAEEMKSEVAPAAPGPDPRQDPRVLALSWLDRLPLVDRFALFA